MSLFIVLSSVLTRRCLLLEPLQTTSFPSVKTSCTLQALVFTSPQSSVYSHMDYVLHSMPETTSHRKIRLRQLSGGSKGSLVTSPGKGPVSPTKLPTSPRHPKSPTKSLQLPKVSMFCIHSKTSLT